MFVSPLTMATYEQLEDLIEMKTITAIHLHFFFAENYHVSTEEDRGNGRRDLSLEGTFQNTKGIFG